MLWVTLGPTSIALTTAVQNLVNVLGSSALDYFQQHYSLQFQNASITSLVICNSCYVSDSKYNIITRFLCNSLKILMTPYNLFLQLKIKTYHQTSLLKGCKFSLDILLDNRLSVSSRKLNLNTATCHTVHNINVCLYN